MDFTSDSFPKLNKEIFSVSQTFDDHEEKTYWWSRTPHERLQHLEMLRRINYGHLAAERLQRVLDVAQFSRG